MAATVPPQLRLIGIQISLIFCMEPLELRYINIAVTRKGCVTVLFVDKVIPEATHLCIGLVGRIGRCDNMFQAHKAFLQLGICSQQRCQLILDRLQLCRNGICLSISRITCGLINDIQVCFFEQIGILAGLSQLQILVDQNCQRGFQCICIQSVLCISYIMQRIGRDFRSICQITGGIISKGIIKLCKSPHIIGHNTLTY